MKRTRSVDVAFSEVWPTVAEKYELGYQPDENGSGTVSGSYAGREIVIPPRSRYRRPGGYLTIEMTVTNAQNSYFTLSSGFRSSILKRYKAKGIETADKTFDQQFMLKGDPTPLIRLLFKSASLRRATLKARWMGSLDIKLYENTLSFLLKDQGMANVRHMESYLELLKRLADVIDELPPLMSLKE